MEIQIPESEPEWERELKREMEYLEKFLAKLAIPPEYISFVKEGGSLIKRNNDHE